MYVLDIKRGPFRDSPPSISCYTSNHYTFHIKIDISGNVDIKQQGTFHCNGSSGGITEHGQPMDMLLIKDNIPIPTEILNTIKMVINFPIEYSPAFRYVVDQIKSIKEDLKVKKDLKIKEDREKEELKLRNETLEKDLKIKDSEKEELKIRNETLEKELKEMKKQVLKLERNMIMNKMIYNEDTDTFEPE